MSDDTTLSAASNPQRTEVPLVAGISNNFTAGGMTYLQMLRRLRLECGVSGSDPSSVEGLPGEMQRLSNWIKQSWLDIQTLHPDWEFLRQPISFVTSTGKQKYNTIEMQIQSFGSLKMDSFTFHPLNDRGQEQELPFMDYDIFRRLYMFGPNAEQVSRPVCFTINSQRDFLLGHTPDQEYRILGEGFAMPTELQGNNDRPACPGQFHMAIVYLAMTMYGMYEAAPEVVAAGQRGYDKLIARMAADQLPKFGFGSPLA